MDQDLGAGGVPFQRVEEHPQVQAAVAAAAAVPQPPTLGSLIASWRGMVEEVEEGYAWCGPEFSNDCWCRDVLERALPMLPKQVAAAVRSQLHVMDERFREATIPWPGHEERSGRWWHRRVPRVLQPDVGEQYADGWPLGWDMMPFPKPEAVQVVRPDGA